MTKYFLSKEFPVEKGGMFTVFLNSKKGELIKISEVGSFICEYIEEPRSLDEIVSHICENFDISKKEAGKDTQEFLADSLKTGIISKL
jgi:hypothetical protein